MSICPFVNDLFMVNSNIYVAALVLHVDTEDTLDTLNARLGSVVGEMIATHAAKDLGPWLDGAYTTLVAANSIQRIPTFDIRELHSLDASISSIKVLNTFTDETWKLHDLTTAFQDGTASPKDACAKLSQWNESCRQMAKLIPMIEAKLAPVQVKMQGIAEDFIKRKIRSALSETSKLLARARTDTSTLSEQAVGHALTHCDEASLLATGIECAADKETALKAVSVARCMLDYLFRMHHDQKGKAMKAIATMSKECDLSLESTLGGPMIDKSWRQEFFQGLHNVIFASEPVESDSDNVVSTEQFQDLAVSLHKTMNVFFQDCLKFEC